MKIIHIVFFTLLGFIAVFLWNKRKKEAENFCFEIQNLLGCKKWKMHANIPHSLFIKGNFKLREIKCVYTVALETQLQLSSPPKIIPKKISFFKFRDKYPFIYKKYYFNGSNVLINKKLSEYPDKKISKEEANSLLDDLVHACEMVERGEYEI